MLCQEKPYPYIDRLLRIAKASEYIELVYDHMINTGGDDMITKTRELSDILLGTDEYRLAYKATDELLKYSETVHRTARIGGAGMLRGGL